MLSSCIVAVKYLPELQLLITGDEKGAVSVWDFAEVFRQFTANLLRPVSQGNQQQQQSRWTPRLVNWWRAHDDDIAALHVFQEPTAMRYVVATSSHERKLKLWSLDGVNLGSLAAGRDRKPLLPRLPSWTRTSTASGRRVLAQPRVARRRESADNGATTKHRYQPEALVRNDGTIVYRFPPLGRSVVMRHQSRIRIHLASRRPLRRSNRLPVRWLNGKRSMRQASQVCVTQALHRRTMTSSWPNCDRIRSAR